MNISLNTSLLSLSTTAVKVYTCSITTCSKDRMRRKEWPRTISKILTEDAERQARQGLFSGRLCRKYEKIVSADRVMILNSNKCRATRVSYSFGTSHFREQHVIWVDAVVRQQTPAMVCHLSTCHDKCFSHSLLHTFHHSTLIPCVRHFDTREHR